MAHVAPAKPAPFGAETVYRLVSATYALWSALRAHWIAARTRDQLARLSPRELADVGLAECDLRDVARAFSARAR